MQTQAGFNAIATGEIKLGAGHKFAVLGSPELSPRNWQLVPRGKRDSCSETATVSLRLLSGGATFVHAALSLLLLGIIFQRAREAEARQS